MRKVRVKPNPQIPMFPSNLNQWILGYSNNNFSSYTTWKPAKTYDSKTSNIPMVEDFMSSFVEIYAYPIIRTPRITIPIAKRWCLNYSLPKKSTQNIGAIITKDALNI